MKKVFQILIALLVSSSLFADELVENTRPLNPFQTIIVDNQFVADFEIGETYAITIYAKNQEAIDKTITSVVSDTLKVYYAENVLKNVSVKITAPSIQTLGAKNLAKIQLKNPLTTDSLKIVLSGTGSMALNALYCKKVNIVFNGVGKVVAEAPIKSDIISVSLNGTCSANFEEIDCQYLKIYQAGGSGCYLNGDLKCNQLDAYTEGVGTFQAKKNVTASEKIYLAVHGAGSSIIDGNVTAPQIDTEMIGTGRVAMKQLESNRLSAQLKGIGNIILGGHTKQFYPTLAGLGQIIDKTLVVKE